MSFDSKQSTQDSNLHFSRNRIVIRERGILDILDLALVVFRGNAFPLAIAFCVGVLPVMGLNGLILSPLADPEFRTEYVYYTIYMLPLVVWTMPLATAPMTLVLGQILFSDRVDGKKVARDFVKSLPQLLWYQVLLRGLLTPLFLTWFFFYSYRPYFNEVILLDRNPMRASSKEQMTSGRRSSLLHRMYAGELFSRWLCSAIVGSLLVAAVWFTIAMVRAVFSGGANWYMPWDITRWDGPMFTWYYSLSLWLVVGFFAVVRFLGYVDLRIRREGWEVELMMRAERARMSRQLT